MTARRRRGRGYTLVELAVYMGLVTTALMVFARVELSAQQTVAVQGAMIDIESQASRFLGSLRKDVEGSLRVSVQDLGRELLVHRPDGTAVIYRAGERVIFAKDGRREARESFGVLSGLQVAQAKDGLLATATLSKGGIRRTFHCSALPRREVRGE